MSSDRQAEKARLIAQRDALRRKYPAYPEGLPGNLEPEDILAHVRECVRFGPKGEVEHWEIAFVRNPLEKYRAN